MPTDAACPTCGAELEPDAAFCGSCGQRVTRPSADQPAAPIAPPVAVAASVPVDPGGSGRRAATSVAPPPAVAAPAPAAVDTGWHLGLDVETQVAPVGRRLLALLVDQLVAAILIGGAAVAVLPGLRDGGSVGVVLVPGLVAVLVAAGQWIAEAFSGATVGGALLGIRTVSARTGRPAGLWAVLVRSVVQGLGGVLAGVGVYLVAASGAWDEGPGRRGWHDKAAGTLVLRARAVRRGRADAVAGASLRQPEPVAITPLPVQPGSFAGAPLPVQPGPVTGPPLPVPPEPVPSPPVPIRAEPAVPTAMPSAPTPAVTRAQPEPTGSTPAADPTPTYTEPEPAPSIPVDTLPTLPQDSAPIAPEGLGDLELTRVAGPRTEVPLRLVFDTGERVDVTGPGLVGRRPSASAGEPEPAHLVAITDPAQSVSRVHLAFRPTPGGLVIVDRGSTNGTVLVDPSGSRWALPAGQEARVSPGWSVVFGERTVLVERA